MIENNESGDEYIIGTVILAQDIKLARQRRRIAQLEAAILQLRESAVHDRILANDTRSNNRLTDSGPAPCDRERADSHPASPPRCHPSVTQPLTFES